MIRLQEAPKLLAFARRDFKIMMSYRMGAVSGLLGIIVQVVAFSFLGKLVDPARMPLFGGVRATYIEFVAIGICINMTVLLLIHELSRALRAEQMIPVSKRLFEYVKVCSVYNHLLITPLCIVDPCSYP